MDSERKRKEVMAVMTALQEEDKEKMMQLRKIRRGWTQNTRERRR